MCVCGLRVWARRAQKKLSRKTMQQQQQQKEKKRKRKELRIEHTKNAQVSLIGKCNKLYYN